MILRGNIEMLIGVEPHIAKALIEYFEKGTTSKEGIASIQKEFILSLKRNLEEYEKPFAPIMGGLVDKQDKLLD